MEPRSDLLVFTKKEVGVLAVLLILVSLLSFTLGLRVGRSIQTTKSVLEESKEAPLHDQAEVTPAETEHAAADLKSPEGKKTPEAEQPVAEAKKEDAEAAPAINTEAAEDKADAALGKEISETKGKLNQKIARNFPAKKLGSTETTKWTLQVGSHRTVAEAAEQVANLKRKNFDAFYIEANPQGKGIWYRVGIGVYESKELAEKAVAELKQKGSLPNYIVQKVTD